MIRSELVARIAEQNPHLHARDVEAVVDTILDRISQALADGNRVELRGFGSFEPRQREARSGRNSRTQAEVNVAARITVQFRAGKAAHHRLNRIEISPEQKVALSESLPGSTLPIKADKSLANHAAIRYGPARAGRTHP